MSAETVTIANGASLSAEVDLGGQELVAIMMPAAWTAANLTFQAAEKSAGTFNDVDDDAGTEVNVTAAASKMILLTTASKKLWGLNYIKIRSGTSGVPVNQGAERTLTLMMQKRR